MKLPTEKTIKILDTTDFFHDVAEQFNLMTTIATAEYEEQQDSANCTVYLDSDKYEEGVMVVVYQGDDNEIMVEANSDGELVVPSVGLDLDLETITSSKLAALFLVFIKDEVQPKI